MSVHIKQSDHVPLVMATMATSAAPLYFPAINIDDDLYVDGGMDANCPVQETLGVAEVCFSTGTLNVCVVICIRHPLCMI